MKPKSTFGGARRAENSLWFFGRPPPAATGMHLPPVAAQGLHPPGLPCRIHGGQKLRKLRLCLCYIDLHMCKAASGSITVCGRHQMRASREL